MSKAVNFEFVASELDRLKNEGYQEFTSVQIHSRIRERGKTTYGPSTRQVAAVLWKHQWRFGIKKVDKKDNTIIWGWRQ